jgi:hypothetical protein
MIDPKKTTVDLSALGLLPMVLAFVFLASIGTCGEGCQSCTQDGIAGTVKAMRGEK